MPPRPRDTTLRGLHKNQTQPTSCPKQAHVCQQAPRLSDLVAHGAKERGVQGIVPTDEAAPGGQ
eukprot:scaffold411_cov73-Isochrysis_galbana.AAC.2